jgi:ABC-type ATPase with predicted acetyltransferase domain
MKYTDKVKKCQPFHTKLNELKDGDRMSFQYNGATYEVSAYKSYNDELSYSVWKDYRGMNVSKVGRTSLSLYSFDMMGQKTTYRMDFLDMEIL